MSDTEFEKTCTIGGCGRPVIARGLCRRHYSRWYRTGTTDDPDVIPGECYDWLDAHICFSGNECLTWPYARSKTGYGVVSFAGRMQLAGRAMCILAHGPAPSATHEAAHNCGKGHLGCVNPRHLRWATPTENQADRAIHGTILRGEDAPQAKLSESDVIAIKRLLGTARHKDIAERFGVSRSLIGVIANGKRWAHVSP